MANALSCEKGPMLPGTEFSLVSHSLADLPDGSQALTVTVSCCGCVTTEMRPLLKRGYKAGTKKLEQAAFHLMMFLATNWLLFMPSDRIDRNRRGQALRARLECS